MGRIYHEPEGLDKVPTDLEEKDPDVAVVLTSLMYDDEGFKAIGAPDDRFAAVFTGLLQVGCSCEFQV